MNRNKNTAFIPRRPITRTWQKITKYTKEMYAQIVKKGHLSFHLDPEEEESLTSMTQRRVYTNMEITKFAAKSIVRVIKNRNKANVRMLEISHCREGFCEPERFNYVIGFLFYNTVITRLHLDHNGIYDGQCVAIGLMLQYNKTLTILSLEHNLITSDGMVTICEYLSLNSTLKELYMNNNYIGDTGCAALKYVIECPNTVLEALSIADNFIFDKGLEDMAKGLALNKTLKRFFIQANYFCSYAIERLGFYLQTNETLTHLWMLGHRLNNHRLAEMVAHIQHNKTLLWVDVCEYRERLVSVEIREAIQDITACNRAEKQRTDKIKTHVVERWELTAAQHKTVIKPFLVSYALQLYYMEDPVVFADGSEHYGRGFAKGRDNFEGVKNGVVEKKIT